MGASSTGEAGAGLVLHAGGHRFEPCTAHHPSDHPPGSGEGQVRNCCIVDWESSECYLRCMGVMQGTGTVHGDTISLDTPLEPLEGRRVRVRVEPIEDADLVISAEQNAVLWKEWAERGPQGPIDGDDEWPDDL